MSQDSANQRYSRKSGKRRDEPVKRPRQNIFRRILQGNVLTSDFFLKNWLKVFVALVLIMIYISTKYQCMTSRETIKKLETELEVIKTESIRERSTYMSRIRESAMSQLADSVRPGLRVQQHPPFSLAYPKAD